MPPKTKGWMKKKKNTEAKQQIKENHPFRGQGRTMADVLKAKEEREERAEKEGLAQPVPTPVVEPKVDETPWIPKQSPIPNVIPGPGQRSVKTSEKSDGFVFKPSEESLNVKDEEYALKASDIPKNYGQPKTFADVRKSQRAVPLVAKIKFDVRANKKIFSIEAQFATKETIDDVYDFLEKEVFEGFESIEIYNTFPRKVIPKDGKTLAQLKITGSVMLSVVATGEGKFKIKSEA